MKAYQIALLLAAATLPAAVRAELPVGAAAPPFATRGALAGKPFTFDLRSALRRGPVVLYFYPKAFTQGCTLEARAFAEAHDQFAAAGATVMGMSADDIGTLQRFSTAECRGKFAVGVATSAIVSAYDVAFPREALPAAIAATAPANMTSRTSYVIGRNGRIVLVHSDNDYRDHVRLTLQAVQALRRR